MIHVNGLIVTLCVTMLTACGRAADSKRPPSTRTAGSAAPAVAGAPPSAPLPQPPPEPPKQDVSDSIYRQAAALEDSIARDSLGPRAPQQLWRLAELLNGPLRELSVYSLDSAYAHAHPLYYDYSEPDAQFVYNGLHFTLLPWRFPHDTLAALAAYQLTELGIVGECEGFVACYIGRELEPLREFLERFPNATQAPEAVRRANDAFEHPLSHKPEPNDAWEVDSADIRKEIAGYDSTVQVLPAALRRIAMPEIEKLRSHWGRPAPDTAVVEPGGSAVDFRSERCGVAFKYPDTWEVIESPHEAAAAICANEVRRKHWTHHESSEREMDAFSVRVSTLQSGWGTGVRSAPFAADSGQWFSTGFPKWQAGAVTRRRAGAAWHGLTGETSGPCYDAQGAHQKRCDAPVAFIGTDKQSARITAGQQSTAVFDLILRSITFEAARSP